MAFLKRVLSSDYRRALAAEAGGEYLEAARAYALAGERAKVAEMHLYLAERAGSPDGRLAELRAALRWADGSDEPARTLRRHIGRALLSHVRAQGTRSERDLTLLREAAALLAATGDHAGAGECHELAGDDTQAADSYQQAGEVERLEAVLAREEHRDQRSTRLRQLFDEHRLLDGRGERDAAIARLEECVRLDPGGGSAELLATLRERRLSDGNVALREDAGARHRYAGAFPFPLGRDAGGLVLHDAGVSRRHAEIVSVDGTFRVRDAGSRNGTRLGGVPIEGVMPLVGEGELGLGRECVVRFVVQPEGLRLEIARGRDRGLVLLLSSRPISIAGGLATLRFDAGRPMLRAAPGVAMRLGGHRGAEDVQLLRDDVIELQETLESPAVGRRARLEVGA